MTEAQYTQEQVNRFKRYQRAIYDYEELFADGGFTRTTRLPVKPAGYDGWVSEIYGEEAPDVEVVL